jgi:ligand-binding sensor domain-containing protein
LASDSNIFAGTENGVFLSSDNDTSWSAANDGLTNTQVFAFALNGTNLFAGTYGGGVFRSTNNGESWTPVSNGLTSKDALSFAVTGTNLFAGTLPGVFISTDSGKSWNAASNGIKSDGITTFAVVGSDIFAGNWTYGGGFFRSTDNGISWTSLIIDSLCGSDISSLAVVGNNLFAGIRCGVFLSSNKGASWTEADSGLPLYYGPVQTFAVSGTDLFAGTYNGVFLSTDNGSSWTAVNIGLTDTNVFALAVLGTDLFAGTDSGVWRRPLSQMLPASAVAEPQTSSSEIQSYPNPFSQSTTIAFSSPESGMAEITIVNLLGSEVAQIFSGELAAGRHEFTWDAGGMPPGMYECIVRMNGSVERVPVVIMH